MGSKNAAFEFLAENNMWLFSPKHIMQNLRQLGNFFTEELLYFIYFLSFFVIFFNFSLKRKLKKRVQKILYLNILAFYLKNTLI